MHRDARGVAYTAASQAAVDGFQAVVDESLHVDLTGWAKPIYSAELSEAFLNDMEAE